MFDRVFLGFFQNKNRLPSNGVPVSVNVYGVAKSNISCCLFANVL